MGLGRFEMIQDFSNDFLFGDELPAQLLGREKVDVRRQRFGPDVIEAGASLIRLGEQGCGEDSEQKDRDRRSYRHRSNTPSGAELTPPGTGSTRADR